VYQWLNWLVKFIYSVFHRYNHKVLYKVLPK